MPLSKKDKIFIRNFKKRLTEGTLVTSRMTYKPQNLKEKLRMDLCESIIIFRQNEGLTPKEIASLAGVTEQQMEEITNYHIEKEWLTIDALLDIIDRINSCTRVTTPKGGG